LNVELRTWDQSGERLVGALGYAAKVHAGQLKQIDGQPYIAHLLRVSGIVIGAGGTEDEAIGALLHDAVEDQGGQRRLAEIEALYGVAVAEIVDQCTDTYLRPKPSWRRRKVDYLEHLAESSASALLVSLADKIDNVRGVVDAYRLDGEGVWSRSGRRAEDVRWYYGALAERFAQLRPGPLTDELMRGISELDRLIAQRRQPLSLSF
jgi:(p)ppGpp synthase/HD superfamily hydrolase